MLTRNVYKSKCLSSCRRQVQEFSHLRRCGVHDFLTKFFLVGTLVCSLCLLIMALKHDSSMESSLSKLPYRTALLRTSLGMLLSGNCHIPHSDVRRHTEATIPRVDAFWSEWHCVEALNSNKRCCSSLVASFRVESSYVEEVYSSGTAYPGATTIAVKQWYGSQLTHSQARGVYDKNRKCTIS